MFIELEHISKTFPGVKALSDVSISLKEGEIHALLGENGAGKSTLIKILTGVYQPDEGAQIHIGNETFSSLTPIQAMRSGIAVTYQDFALFPNLSVAENIAIGNAIEKGTKVLSWKEMRAVAKAALDRIHVNLNLSETLDSLSAAKQQLVAIARALVSDAKLLILDEPTSALSKSEVENLFDIIRQLRDEGITILFIGHKLDEIFAVSERITILRDGTFIGTYDADKITVDEVIAKMVGRSVEYERLEVSNVSDEVLLKVENLSCAGNYADVSFELRKGEILGLTGLVGSGRTELCLSFLGLNKPESGHMYLEGQELVLKDTEDAVKKGIAFVPEDRRTQGLVVRKDVQSNITLAILKRLTNKLGLLKSAPSKQIVTTMMDKLRVHPNIPDMEASKLSGGNQQRVVIAKWLATNPKVLIIDEPTNGVDIGAKNEIHQMLRDLADQGIGIIMISSELPEILALSTRILVMRRGRIAAEFAGKSATQEEIMHKAIL